MGSLGSGSWSICIKDSESKLTSGSGVGSLFLFLLLGLGLGLPRGTFSICAGEAREFLIEEKLLSKPLIPLTERLSPLRVRDVAKEPIDFARLEVRDGPGGQGSERESRNSRTVEY
jgi:hypothetical protein